MIKIIPLVAIPFFIGIFCQSHAQGSANCPYAENFVVSDVTTSSAVFTWDSVPEVEEGYTLNLYELGVFTPFYSEFIPATSALTTTVTDLPGNTGFDTLLISNCTSEIMNDGTYAYFRTLIPIPENDACSDAIDIFCDTVISATNIGATDTEQSLDLCGLTEGQDGIWYTFENTLPFGSELTFSLCTSTGIFFDSQMALYSGSCGDLECVDANNDACNALSEISIITDDTDRYYLYVFGAEHGRGDFELIVSCDISQQVNCNATANTAVSNPTGTTVDMSWDQVPTAFDGYQTFIVLEGDDPRVDPIVFESSIVPQTTTSMTATGLNESTVYDAYIVSMCDINNDMVQYSAPFTFNSTLSTPTFELANFSMFPNPANDFVTIKATTNIDMLEVYTITGQIVLKNTPNNTEFSIDVSQLQTGAYFVKTIANGETSTKKMIRK